MKNKVTIKKGTVQETLMFPLYGRSICNAEKPAVFGDAKAKEIISRIDYDFKNANMGKGPVYVYGMRGQVLIDAAKQYLKEYPDAIIVNLGCGLDTSFYQLDNGRMRYVNIDFPEVIAFREQLFETKDRELNLGMDATDLSWMEKIGAGPTDHVFVIAGGVFYYIKPAEVKKLIAALAKRFKKGGIIFDYENEKMMQQSNKMVKKAGNHGAEMYYSVNDAEKEIPAYSTEIESAKFMKSLPDKYKCIPGFFRFFFNLEFKKGMMGYALLRFR